MKNSRYSLSSLIALCTLAVSSCAGEISPRSVITPRLMFFTTHVPEDTPIGSSIGVIEVEEEGDSTISNFQLSDTGEFEINAEGEITTKVTFNYAEKSTYFLQVFATNEAGEGESSEVLVKITQAARPTLGDLEISIPEEGRPGEVLALIPVINEGQGPIESFTLSDERHFEVSPSGELIAKSSFNYQEQKLYRLKVSATNEVGEGFSSNIMVHIIDPIVTIPYCENRPLLFKADAQKGKPWPVSTHLVEDRLRVEWCPVEATSQFKVRYGTQEKSLTQHLIKSPGVRSYEISNLRYDTEYFTSVLATLENGISYSTEPIKAIINTRPRPFDLSIDKVTFNQAVQIDLEDDFNETPVIAHKSGVLRVFVNSDSPHQSLKVEVKLGGTYRGAPLSPIIKEVALRDSPFIEAESNDKVIHFDLDDPEWLREGTSFFIELDPSNKLTERVESNNRYPREGEIDFGFKEVPPMRVKLFSVVTNNGNQRGEVTEELKGELESYLRSLYPISDVEISEGATLISSTSLSDDVSSWAPVLSELANKKNTLIPRDSAEEGVFYFGVIDCEGNCPQLAGLATLNLTPVIAQLTGMARVDRMSPRAFAEVVAHEIGHNHGRRHVNASDARGRCGFPEDVDPNYPYNSPGSVYGLINKTGYHHDEYRLLEGARYHDMMSYCTELWISDYTYTRLYRFQERLYENTSENKKAQSEGVEGVMIYGDLSYGEHDQLIPTQHLKQEMRLPTERFDFKSDVSAMIKFQGLNEMILPLQLMSLDHGDSQLFQLFIPTLEVIEEIVIQDSKRGQKSALID